MEIELGTALAAVEVSGVLIILLALLVRSFAALEMPLYHFEHLPAHNGFVGVFKNQYVVEAVLQPPFQLIGLGVGLKVDRISGIGLILQHLSHRPLRPVIGPAQIRVSRTTSRPLEVIHAGAGYLFLHARPWRAVQPKFSDWCLLRKNR